MHNRDMNTMREGIYTACTRILRGYHSYDSYHLRILHQTFEVIDPAGEVTSQA